MRGNTDFKPRIDQGFVLTTVAVALKVRDLQDANVVDAIGLVVCHFFVGMACHHHLLAKYDTHAL